jgi:DNA polymerase epsilon subunit 2
LTRPLRNCVFVLHVLFLSRGVNPINSTGKMMIVNSPRKSPQNPVEESPERRRRSKSKPPIAPFFAPKNLASKATRSDAIPSSSPAFATPVHPLKPFSVVTSTILPIILPPATLRPLAFRTFTKKHSLTLTSSALQELATFIGRHCGSGWREEGLAEKVLEEAAKSWKNRNGGVIVDGSSAELKDILKTLEANMSGGKIITGGRGLSRQNSLLLEPTREADHSKIRLGLRPNTMLTRNDSQASFGMSGLDVEGDEDGQDDEGRGDVRRWIKVIDAFEQPRYVYNVGKKHFER